MGGPENNTAAAAEASEAADSAALAAELADAAAVDDAAAGAIAPPGDAAPGLDDDELKPVAEDAAIKGDTAVEEEADGPPPDGSAAAGGTAVKAETGGEPPGLITGNSARDAAAGVAGLQQAGDSPARQDAAAVKPDLDQLDAAHDTVVAAAAEGDAAGAMAAAKVEADALDAAGGPTTAPAVSPSAGPGSAVAPETIADPSEVKAELLENAEASAPSASGGVSGSGEAQRRSSRGVKKRTRWGDDPDEAGDQEDGGSARAVKVKSEPR